MDLDVGSIPKFQRHTRYNSNAMCAFFVRVWGGGGKCHAIVFFEGTCLFLVKTWVNFEFENIAALTEKDAHNPSKKTA